LVQRYLAGEDQGVAGGGDPAQLFQGVLRGAADQEVLRKIAQCPREVVVVEVVGQRAQDRCGGLVVPPLFGESGGEQVAPVPGDAAPPGEQRPGPVGDPQVVAGSQNRRGEADGGQVSFADLAQAYRHAALAGFQVALVGVLDHGGVAQRRRLHRVLVAEVGPDEQARGGREVAVPAGAVVDQVVVVAEGGLDVVVAATEAVHRLPQQPTGLGLVETGDAVDDGAGAAVHERGVFAGYEEFDDDAPVVRGQHQVEPGAQLRRGHAAAMTSR
jgi:hypothetical protein